MLPERIVRQICVKLRGLDENEQSSVFATNPENAELIRP